MKSIFLLQKEEGSTMVTATRNPNTAYSQNLVQLRWVWVRTMRCWDYEWCSTDSSTQRQRKPSQERRHPIDSLNSCPPRFHFWMKIKACSWAYMSPASVWASRLGEETPQSSLLSERDATGCLNLVLGLESREKGTSSKWPSSEASWGMSSSTLLRWHGGGVVVKMLTRSKLSSLSWLVTMSRRTTQVHYPES